MLAQHRNLLSQSSKEASEFILFSHDIQHQMYSSGSLRNTYVLSILEGMGVGEGEGGVKDVQ